MCLAKALGLWLLSPQHRASFDGAPAAAVESAVRTLGLGSSIAEAELTHDEGRVVAPPRGG